MIRLVDPKQQRAPQRRARPSRRRESGWTGGWVDGYFFTAVATSVSPCVVPSTFTTSPFLSALQPGEKTVLACVWTDTDVGVTAWAVTANVTSGHAATLDSPEIVPATLMGQAACVTLTFEANTVSPPAGIPPST